MKINWFCPLLPEKTDIAHYTSRILTDLQQQTEIILWTDKRVWLPELEQQATVRWYDPNDLPMEELASANINIYNIGNNNDFHGSIWQVSRQFPGIVVIHDVNLHYLLTCFYEKYLKPGADQEAYVELMRQCHGQACNQDLQKFFKGKLDWGIISERYPLAFAAVENALGVIVHTSEAYEMFSRDQRCHCPVLYSPLPYPSTPIHAVNPVENSKGSPYRLVIFGYLGGLYRRVQSVLEALGGMREKSRFRLDIYGQIWDKGYIQGLIQQFKLEDIVSLHGFVAESVLDKALASADLVFNLRYPTGGEASGSQMRIWSHGLPSLVTRIGWYADLPEDSIAFVSHDHEIEDIQQQLRNFLTNPAKFKEIGQRGQQVLAQEHAPAVYAKRVVEFAKKIVQKPDSFATPVTPHVSVIIPTYNCAHFVQQAVDSVLQQTYSGYEIIVVDDGSTDYTQQLLKSYRDRIRYSYFQNNQGVSVARNRGIEMARGKLIAFLDADDWYFPEKLEAEVKFLDKERSAGMCLSGFRMVNETGGFQALVQPWQEYPQLNLETWVSLRPLLSSTMMFRREWLEWVGGFDTNYHYAEDTNLILRLALMGCKAAWLPQVTVYCRQPSQHTVHHTPEKAKYLERALENLFAQDLPESVKSMKNQVFFESCVWSAWNLYNTGYGKEQTKYLQKSMNYTDLTTVDCVSEWVRYFQTFSTHLGYDFDAYELSGLGEWKEMMQRLLTVKGI